MSQTSTFAAAPSGRWKLPLAGIFALVAIWGLGGSAWRIATEGVGILGVNNGVPWGWDIALFVFWIGIGHAGTLISAVLLLTRQRWRLPIARHAELMTLCAVCTAAVFPLVHVGRVYMLWQMAPIPQPGGVWPNMASALVWDAAAISSYFLLSVLFWYMGIRGERVSEPTKQRVSARSCMLMAALLTPLVITVHSVVGCDFAVTFRWQSVIIPPYFVCGAILSGLAVVQIIAILRSTAADVTDKLSRLTLVLSATMGLFYLFELCTVPEHADALYGGIILLNVGIPLLLLSSRKLNRHKLIRLAAALSILAGMWLERIQIIISRSESATGIPYSPTQVDVAMLLGSIGLFCALYLSISARMPEEKHDPLDIPQAEQAKSPGIAAAIGFTSGVALAILWSLLTQQADTAGVLSSRPHGLFYHFPAIVVIGLLCAGLAVFINFSHNLRRA